MKNNEKKLLTGEEVVLAFDRNGTSVTDWAKKNGFNPNNVWKVINGTVPCKRGEVHKIAVALHMKEGTSIPLDEFFTANSLSA